MVIDPELRKIKNLVRCKLAKQAQERILIVSQKGNKDAQEVQDGEVFILCKASGPSKGQKIKKDIYLKRFLFRKDVLESLWVLF